MIRFNEKKANKKSLSTGRFTDSLCICERQLRRPYQCLCFPFPDCNSRYQTIVMHSSSVRLSMPATVTTYEIARRSSSIRNFSILRPAAMLVSHKLLDLGIVMWALRWPRNLGLIFWCRVGVPLTQDLAYSRYILGHLTCGKSVFPLHKLN